MQPFFSALWQKHRRPAGKVELTAAEAQTLCAHLLTLQKLIQGVAQHWIARGCPEADELCTPEATRQGLSELWSLEGWLARLEHTPASALATEAAPIRAGLAAYQLTLSRAATRLIAQTEPALALRLLNARDLPWPALLGLRDEEPKWVEAARKPERGPWTAADSASLGVGLSILARGVWAVVQQVGPEIEVCDPPLACGREFRAYFSQPARERERRGRKLVPARGELDRCVGLSAGLTVYGESGDAEALIEEENWRALCQTLRAMRECLFRVWDLPAVSGPYQGEPVVSGAAADAPGAKTEE
jgi:hypothetical protein